MPSIMHTFQLLLAILTALSSAMPQYDCSTTTTEVIVPTLTYTFSSTDVITQYPTTAKDLGTFTLVVTKTTTTTLRTLATTTTACSATGIAVAPIYTTVYTNASQSYVPARQKRKMGLQPRAPACVVTVTTTATYGVTETYVPAGRTSTFYDYTSFTQATVTSTKDGGKAYVIATVTDTVTHAVCGTTTVTDDKTSTVTHDARCAPAALTSAYEGFGLEYKDDAPLGGAGGDTTTADASQCCQLCADDGACAASSWDSRTGQCTLEYAVDYDSGELNCGAGLLAYYDAGPDHPMAPGAGLFVQALCGNVEFGSAPPDDGS